MTTHPHTSHIIGESWGKGSSLVSKLKNTKMALEEWNKIGFGNMQGHILNLKQAIQQLQDNP